MARPQGRYEQAEVREDRREEADDADQGAVRGLPWCVPRTHGCVFLFSFRARARADECAEEFSIYLNYVRKLGFEETPDYDFLRELFAKVLKNNGDVEDGVYDWNLLNGEAHVRLSRPCTRN